MKHSIDNHHSKHFFLSAAPLFLVLFIDSMGLGLVFPILNTLFFDSSANFFDAGVNGTSRNVLYGFTIGVYMLCWFFGAALLGDLSDQIGRKKSLVICLCGAFIGYFISVMAVVFSSYSLLMIGRVVAGFTAGSQSIAQAAIIDLSDLEDKAKNLGLISLFSSIGFAFGPIIGGVLSASSLVTWFNFTIPFYFAAAISLINIILLYYFFHETFTHVNKIRFKPRYAINIFVSAFKNEQLRELSIIFLIMIFGWSGFYSFISMYLLKVYQFSSLENGFYLGLMGAGFGIGTGCLIVPLTKRYSLKLCTIVGSILAALGMVLTVTAPIEIFVWIDVLLVSVAMAVAYSIILTLFSNQVDKDSQGWVMGIAGTIMAFAYAVNGLLLGLMANFCTQAPLVISAACLLLSAVLMKLFII